MHSSTTAGSICARRTASATTSAPSWVAESDFSSPRNLPVGVRTAETMTVSRALTDRDPLHGVVAQKSLQAIEDDRRRPPHFARPLRGGGVDVERAAVEPYRRLAFHGRTDGRAPGERDFAWRERGIFQKFGQCAGQRRVEWPHE